MKKHLIFLLPILTLVFVFSSTAALAADSASTDSQNASVDKVEAQAQLLEKQIAELRAEVSKLHEAQKAALQELKTDRDQIHWNQKAIRQLDVNKAAAKNVAEAKPTTSQISTGFSANSNGEAQFIDALRKNVSVITSPYLGLRSSYDASDLIVNLPSMNEDLVLLLQRQDMQNRANAQGLPFGTRPLLMLSGDILPQLVFGNNYQGQGFSQATLSGAEIAIQAISSSWASGFLALDYDSTAPTAYGQNISTVNNSRLYVSRGFVTIGNLNKFPGYLTAGQMYAPFGNYGNSLITTPLTQAIGRSLIRAFLLGYAKEGAYAQAYLYNGETYFSGSNSIDEGGLNVGYKNSTNDWKYDFGAGVISNMADSQGAQNNGIGSTNFQGFGGPNGSEQIQHRVPGMNLHTEIRYKNWNLNAEYIGATDSYSPLDMTFNGKGASPKATHLELDYNQHLFKRPWTFALAYDHSWQALAYNLPEDSYFAVASVSIWKDTIESIEFRHDENYAGPTTGNGSLTANTGGTAFPAITVPGSSRNTVTMQLGLYF